MQQQSLKHWEQEFRASTPQRPHLGPAPPALALPNVDPIAVALAAPFAPVPLAPIPLAPASMAPAPVSAGQAIATLARALPVAADPAPFAFPRLLPARTKLDMQNVCTPVVAARSLIAHARGLPPRSHSPQVPPATTKNKGC